MSREAMKLALEALGEIEWSNNSQWQSDRAKVAITALRKALEEKREPLYWSVATGWVYDDDTSQERVDETAKQEHEPVAWFSTSPEGKLSNKFACKPKEVNWVEPLYTAPTPRKPLTDEEIKEIAATPAAVVGSYAHALARAIEQTLKEKNN